MRKIIMICLASIVGATACTTNLNEGRVVNKFYEPSRHWTSTHPHRVGSVTTIRTVSHFDDEDYVIIVENLVDKDTIRDRWEVSKEFYKGTSIGDWVNKTK